MCVCVTCISSIITQHLITEAFSNNDVPVTEANKATLNFRNFLWVPPANCTLTVTPWLLLWLFPGKGGGQSLLLLLLEVTESVSSVFYSGLWGENMWAAWAVTIIQTDWWAERRQRPVGEGPPLACREHGDQSEASVELWEADLKASVALESSREGQIPRDKNENGGSWHRDLRTSPVVSLCNSSRVKVTRRGFPFPLRSTQCCV